jgi:hypothetical protein
MAKLKLTPDPTFKTKVAIPVPGAGTADVEFVFKHRTKDEAKAWLDQAEDSDAESILAIATGWNLDDEFNEENITKLCQSYAGAAVAIVNAYLGELRGTRTKN